MRNPLKALTPSRSITNTFEFPAASMTPSSPPQLARQRPLPDPYHADKLPPFSLPLSYLLARSNAASATPNTTAQHATPSQPRIGEITPVSTLLPAPDNNRAPLYTTPKISRLLLTKCSKIPRLDALPDPNTDAAMPPLHLPVSQATVRHRFTSMIHDMMDQSGRPNYPTPRLRND